MKDPCSRMDLMEIKRLSNLRGDAAAVFASMLAGRMRCSDGFGGETMLPVSGEEATAYAAVDEEEGCHVC
ncbi:hypothetical protein ACLOJK_011150 [Asimina triloba]